MLTDGRKTESLVYFVIAHLRAFGSGELNISWFEHIHSPFSVQLHDFT